MKRSWPGRRTTGRIASRPAIRFCAAAICWPYLSMMAVRLIELHRALKPTGSLFLHCDPTASHYIKLILDNIFSPKNFRNEIIWSAPSPRATPLRPLLPGPRHHLFTTAVGESVFNPQFTEHDPGYLEKFYCHVEPETRAARIV